MVLVYALQRLLKNVIACVCSSFGVPECAFDGALGSSGCAWLLGQEEECERNVTSPALYCYWKGCVQCREALGGSHVSLIPLDFGREMGVLFSPVNALWDVFSVETPMIINQVV